MSVRVCEGEPLFLPQGYTRVKMSIRFRTSFSCCLVGSSGYWAARVCRNSQVLRPRSSRDTAPPELCWSHVWERHGGFRQRGREKGCCEGRGGCQPSHLEKRVPCVAGERVCALAIVFTVRTEAMSATSAGPPPAPPSETLANAPLSRRRRRSPPPEAAVRTSWGDRA